MALGTVAWIVIIVVVILAIWIVLIYNSLIRLKNRIQNAWAQIDVQLKRRYDLIPNLIETVKGYAKHEKETLKMVTEARNMMGKAKSVDQKARAENMLTSALKSLFAVAEAYPDLKANQNFMMLQEELSGTENKIAYARQFYNDTVLKYNNKIQVFPSNVIANLIGFKEKEFFETETGERKPVKVKF